MFALGGLAVLLLFSKNDGHGDAGVSFSDLIIPNLHNNVNINIAIAPTLRKLTVVDNFGDPRTVEAREATYTDIQHHHDAHLISAPICGASLSFPSPRNKLMWSPECTSWYNRGNWTLRETPRLWKQTFGYHTWETSRNIPAEQCEHIGKSAEFLSSTNQPKVFEEDVFFRAAQQIGRRDEENGSTTTSILFVGDSVTRQTFAVFLEAIGIPKKACTFKQLVVEGKKYEHRFPTKCRWTTTLSLPTGEERIHNLILRRYDSVYGTEGWEKENGFAQADIILMNFGVWYVENRREGQKTHHTSSTYIQHMTHLLERIQAVRQPHQLIIFRESSEMMNPTNEILVELSHRLRPLLTQYQIPLITRHNSRAKTRLESQFFRDKVHFCEPSVPLAWITVLTYIVRDWGEFLAWCNEGHCASN